MDAVSPHVADTAVLAKAGLAGPQPCGSHLSLSFSSVQKRPRSAWGSFPPTTGGPAGRWWKKECARGSKRTLRAVPGPPGSSHTETPGAMPAAPTEKAREGQLTSQEASEGRGLG